eukprot:scaffold88048_cov69-Phaeocystis_antarctica.AAC.6
MAGCRLALRALAPRLRPTPAPRACWLKVESPHLESALGPSAWRSLCGRGAPPPCAFREARRADGALWS